MTEIKKILVPVDFSTPSEKALGYARTIANTFSSDLVLVSVIEDPMVLPYETPKAHEIYLAGVRAKLAELLPPEVREARNVRVVAMRGDVERALLSAVAEEDADLVVIGSHGRRAFSRWFVGSVTERMLRRAPVPVLTVSHLEEQAQPGSLARGQILYATDIAADHEAGLEIARDLARAFEATLTVLHVIHPMTVEYGTALYIPSSEDWSQLREERRAQLQEQVRIAVGEDSSVRVEVADGKPYQVILDTASRLSADLIVINQHGKSRLERALLGSTADRVIRISELPILSIPAIE